MGGGLCLCAGGRAHINDLSEGEEVRKGGGGASFLPPSARTPRTPATPPHPILTACPLSLTTHPPSPHPPPSGLLHKSLHSS